MLHAKIIYSVGTVEYHVPVMYKTWGSTVPILKSREWDCSVQPTLIAQWTQSLDTILLCKHYYYCIYMYYVGIPVWDTPIIGILLLFRKLYALCGPTAQFPMHTFRPRSTLEWGSFRPALIIHWPRYIARVYRVGRDAFLQAHRRSKEFNIIDPRTARRSEEPVGIQSVRVSDMEDDRVARNRPPWRRRTRSVRALAVPGRLCGREATVWSGCDSIRGTVSVLTLGSVEWDANLAPLALTCKFFFSVLNGK